MKRGRKKHQNNKAIYIEATERLDPVMDETFDDTDPFLTRLPSLVREMQKEHEEVVPPKQWVPYVFLIFVPVAGAVIMFLTAYGKGPAAGKNIRNFALPSAWISAAYTAALGIGVRILFTYGHQIRMWVLGWLGG